MGFLLGGRSESLKVMSSLYLEFWTTRRLHYLPFLGGHNIVAKNFVSTVLCFYDVLNMILLPHETKL